MIIIIVMVTLIRIGTRASWPLITAWKFSHLRQEHLVHFCSWSLWKVDGDDEDDDDDDGDDDDGDDVEDDNHNTNDDDDVEEEEEDGASTFASS